MKKNPGFVQFGEFRDDWGYSETKIIHCRLTLRHCDSLDFRIVLALRGEFVFLNLFYTFEARVINF